MDPSGSTALSMCTVVTAPQTLIASSVCFPFFFPDCRPLGRISNYVAGAENSLILAANTNGAICSSVVVKVLYMGPED